MLPLPGVRGAEPRYPIPLTLFPRQRVKGWVQAWRVLG